MSRVGYWARLAGEQHAELLAQMTTDLYFEEIGVRRDVVVLVADVAFQLTQGQPFTIGDVRKTQ